MHVHTHKTNKINTKEDNIMTSYCDYGQKQWCMLNFYPPVYILFIYFQVSPVMLSCLHVNNMDQPYLSRS